MGRLLSLLIAGALIAGSPGFTVAQEKVKETTKEVAKGTKKVVKKTGKAIAKGTKKVINKGAGATRKGAEKVEDKTDKK